MVPRHRRSPCSTRPLPIPGLGRSRCGRMAAHRCLDRPSPPFLSTAHRSAVPPTVESTAGHPYLYGGGTPSTALWWQPLVQDVATGQHCHDRTERSYIGPCLGHDLGTMALSGTTHLFGSASSCNAPSYHASALPVSFHDWAARLGMYTSTHLALARYAYVLCL
jgi:hypothetical protein